MNKKTILIFVLIICSSITKAQLTLTTASFPHIGGFYESQNDTLGALLTPGTSGANQVWDYSTLNNHYSDTNLILPVLSTPHGAAFSNADFAGKNSQGYAYFVNSATESQMIGVSGSFMGSPVLDIHYTSPNIIAKNGITFNSNYSFVNSFVLTMSGADVGYPQADSVRIHYNTYVSKLVDAWGTVTSPIGPFPCLRIKETDSSVLVADGLLAGFWIPNVYTQTSVNVGFSFMDDADINPIVQINMDSTSATVNSASYRQSWPLGINETLKPSLFSIYPNPATANNIHLLIGGLPADNYAVQIVDVTGRLINSTAYSINKTAVTDVNLGLVHLDAGSYIAVVSTTENKVLQSLKFEVMK